MGISDVFAAFFGLMVVVPVLYLMFTKNIIRAAFAFVISLLGLAATYVLLHAELMAVVQIMIYAGGVIVLLIFGIMLTKRVSDEGVFTQHRSVVLGGTVCAVFFLLLTKWTLSSGLTWTNAEVSDMDQVRKIGVLFLTDHLIAFEVIAFLLLGALVGAAFLAKNQETHDSDSFNLLFDPIGFLTVQWAAYCVDQKECCFRVDRNRADAECSQPEPGGLLKV